MSDVGNIVLWAALIQGLLLALLYMFSKKHQSWANFLLGCFLISIILEALTTILPMRFIGRYAIDTYFALPEVKIFIPLLFLNYILEKIGKASKYNQILKYNYILAAAITALTLFNIYLFWFHDTSLISLFGFVTVEKFHFAQQLYAFSLLIIAFTIAIKETWAYRKLVREQYSDLKMLQINWLWQFIYMLLPATALWGLEIARIIFLGPGESYIETVIWACVVVFLYFLSYKAYLHPNLFDNFSESHLILPEETPGIESHVCHQNQSEAIERGMRDKELFLNPDLTLQIFADNLAMSPRLISTCINKNFGNNFNEWVNNFRVEEALKIIGDDVKNQLSIEGIGLSAGFKSRSTMYSAFQKKMGHSPGYYRKS